MPQGFQGHLNIQTNQQMPGPCVGVFFVGIVGFIVKFQPMTKGVIYCASVDQCAVLNAETLPDKGMK